MHLKNQPVRTPRQCETPIFVAFFPCTVPTWYAKCTFRDTPFSTQRWPPHPKKVIEQKVPFANYVPKQATELLIWHPQICVFPGKKRSAVPELTLGAVRLTSRNWQKRGPISGLTAYIYAPATLLGQKAFFRGEVVCLDGRERAF